MEVIIRKIEKRDDKPLAELIRRTLEKYGLNVPGTAYFDPELDSLSAYYEKEPCKRAYFVACLKDGTLIGGAGFSEYGGIPDCVEGQKLYVNEKLRGQGVGKALLRRALKEASAAGYRSFYLETHSSLKEALSLYEKEGFQRIEKPESAVHSEMDVFMIKNI